jgi:hypothetical protein
MKTFIIGLLLGIIMGAGAVWYFTGGRTTPAVQKAEEHAAAQAGKARESAQAVAW